MSKEVHITAKKKKTKLKIKQATNGFIVEDVYYCGGKKDLVNTYVFKSEENEDGVDEAIVEVLYQVAESLGYEYDKWKENNLSISFDLKGHKID